MCLTNYLTQALQTVRKGMNKLHVYIDMDWSRRVKGSHEKKKPE